MSQLERLRCEVRYVLALRAEDRQKALDYLALVEKRRGIEARKALENEVIAQWNLGNRGKWGDWREQVKAAA
jgi:hypothetical protein